MSALDPPCLDGKEVFLSKPRILHNLDESLIVEIDADLDVKVTLVFRRRTNEPIEFVGPYRDTKHGDRVHRARYPHDVAAELVQQARDRAIDACAEHDGEPLTQRRGTS